MVTLAEAQERIGDGVVYTPIAVAANQVADIEYHGNGMWTLKVEGAHLKAEDGVITSVNDKYVFVRYSGDNHSKATAPENLQFLNKEK